MPKQERTKSDIICFKDDKVQCFNDDKIQRLRTTLSDRAELTALSRRYKALGHPVRLAILELLAREECCVCDLANVLQQPVSTLSQHLKTLKVADLVSSRQSGKFVMYSLREPDLVKTAEFLELAAMVVERTP